MPKPRGRRAEEIFPTLNVEDYAEFGRRRLIRHFDITDRQAQKLRRMIVEALETRVPDAVPDEGPPADQDQVVIDEGGYHFRWRDATGLRELTLSEEQVRSLILSYTEDGDNQSMQATATRHGLSRRDFWKIKSLLGLTKQHEPFSPKQLAEVPLEDLVVDQLALKRRKLAKRVEIDDYRQTKALARKWMELEAGTLDPIQDMLQAVMGGLPPAADLALTARLGDTMVFVQVSDLHYGLAAPGYNRVEASRRFREAIKQQILGAVKLRGSIELGVLGVGGDVAHVDNTHGATTSMRHHQDMDGTPDTLPQEIMQLYLWAVEFMLQHCAEVRIEVIPGNHDEMLSRAFGAGLWARYHDHPRVFFGNMSDLHARWAWGNCAFDGHHGHGDKNTSSLGDGIAAWLRRNGLAAQLHYALTGNLHHVMSKEAGGCLQFQQSSPSEPDRWTEKGNYALSPS